MSDQTYRSYNNFSRNAIKHENSSKDLSGKGWLDYSEDLEETNENTPINADNLNAMLNMLIYIRNVIGKTDDFTKSLNGVDLYKSKEEDGKQVEDIENSVYPNPDNLDDRSIAKYLEAAFNAIIGEGDDDPSNTQIDRTLSGLKKYLEELDASNISYTNVGTEINIKDETDLSLVIKKLDKLIGDLSIILYDGSAVESVSDALSKEMSARAEADQALDQKISDEVSKRESAVTSVNDAIAAINNEETGIKATVIGSSTNSEDDITVYGVRNRVDNLNTTINQKIDDTKNEIIGSDTDDKDDLTLKGLSKAIEDTGNTLGNRIDDITLSDETIYLSGPYTLTKDFGYYKLNGKSSIQVGDSNTTLREFLSGALAETSVGTIDYPSYSYTSGSTSSSDEVGKTFTAPTCTFKVTGVGSYQYGPATDITFSGKLTTADMTDVSFSNLSTNGTATISAKSGGTYTTETQTITFGGTYSYTKGATPKTNIGTTDSSKAIPAKSNQTLSHSRTYTGYYKMFMGIGDANNINSSIIRALTFVNEQETKTTKQVDASINDKSIIWAIRKDFTTNKPTFTYELFGNYETLEGVVGPTVVSVKDAGSGYNDYNVYTYTPASGSFNAPMKTKITIN